MKPTAFIHGWRYWEGINILIGRISDHPRQHTFHGPLQQTSNIVAAPDGYKSGARVETRNTMYVLCGPWDEEQEQKIEALKKKEQDQPVSA